MNNKGQAILTEYVMIFFVVIAALVAITTYVQRGLEARVDDARNFAVKSIANPAVCDKNCQQAAGGISDEYEPYYAQILSDVAQNSATTTGATSGQAWSLGAVYTKKTNEATRTITTSVQLPPQCAGDGPCSE